MVVLRELFVNLAASLKQGTNGPVDHRLRPEEDQITRETLKQLDKHEKLKRALHVLLHCDKKQRKKHRPASMLLKHPPAKAWTTVDVDLPASPLQR